MSASIDSEKFVSSVAETDTLRACLRASRRNKTLVDTINGNTNDKHIIILLIMMITHLCRDKDHMQITHTHTQAVRGLARN